MNGEPGPGRAAQRRRTRAAIVAATAQLLSAGADPSMADIAAAADVSRRTIYTYFSTLDHLLLDATLGALSTDVEAEIAATDADGADEPKAPLARAEHIIDVIGRGTAETLPLGRRLIKLTVTPRPPGPGPNAATGGCSGWRPCWPRGGTRSTRAASRTWCRRWSCCPGGRGSSC